MKLKRLILLLALAPWACTRFDEADRPASEPEIPAEAVVVHDARNARRGSLLVKFTPEAAEELHITGGETRGGGPLGSGLDDIDHVLDRISALELQRVFPVTRHEERTRRAGLHLWYEITFDDTLPVDDVVELLRDKSGQISVLEYNHEICRVGDPAAKEFETEAPAAAPQAADRSYPVNDPQMSFQWNLSNDGTLFSNAAAGADVRAVEAWKYCMGSPDVVVCVVDEGVESDHPDLKANIWTNTREAAGSALRDDDGNGYMDDIYGYNFVSNTGTVSCDKSGDTGHGTHVAGIIAAVNNNGTGVASIAGGSGNNDGVRIMSCQVFDDGKGAGIAGCSRAIKYGADNGAVISQNSWGYSGTVTRDKWLTTYSLEKDAIDYFTTFAGDEDGPMQGGLVFFSAGNDGYKILDNEKFPAAYEPVMAVASMAANYQAAYYTDYGSWVDIAAPGGDYLVDRTYGAILSTTPTSKGTGYGYKQGTSMACPQMSGVAALAVSYVHKLGRRITSDQLREILLASTYDIDSYQTGTKRFTITSDGVSTTYTVNLSDYRGKLGTGCIDAALAMRNILGADLPSADNGRPPVITPLDGTKLEVEYWSSGSLRFDVTDPDGDEVTVTLSDNSSLLRLTGSGSAYTVTLKGSSTRVGSYTATLTATDGTGKKSFVDISYTVKRNYQPQSTPFDDIRFADLAQKITIDAAPHFSDPNGETLSFEVSCSDPELLEITRSGSSFTLSAKRYGRGTVTVKGIDAGGLSATETFEAIARNENLVMEFYPVPVNDVLNIRMGADVTGSIRVKIFNTRGVKVMDTSKSISPAAPASILMSSLAPGNYTVEAAFGEITERRNIVKL